MSRPDPAGPEVATTEPLTSSCLPQDLRPGDILLGRAHGFRHDVLRRGQAMRLRRRQRQYARYTHAALVTSESGDLIEAVGGGVRRSTLRCYDDGREIYRIVHITASDEDRGQMVAFAEATLARRAQYAFLANVSTAFWAFTGSRLVFFLDGSYTCSGLVAAALERTSAHFTTNAARVMPAQLAIWLGAPPPPPDPPRALGRALVGRFVLRGGRGRGIRSTR